MTIASFTTDNYRYAPIPRPGMWPRHTALWTAHPFVAILGQRRAHMPRPQRLVPTPPNDASELDAALAARVRQGDEAAFEQLFRAYFARLATLAFAFVKSREVAEELVQDALLRVWRDRASWDVRGSVRAYLYAAVRHRAISYLRRPHVAAEVPDDVLPMMSSASPSPDVAIEARELDVAIRQAVSELPDRCREAFVLTRQHELSYAEVAGIMGTSVRTVENHVAKARAHLRVRLAAWLS